MCEFSGFCSGVAIDTVLLRYDAVSLSNPSRKFVAQNCPHLPDPMEISALEDKIRCFETYESHYSMTQFHVLEEANRE